MSHLSEFDPEISNAIENEINRQRNGLEMIASENLVSRAVLEALGSPLTNKYSEGYPGKRYYSGNEFIDNVENLAINRAKELFGAEHANMQPHAGSQANMAAYFAMAEPGDKIMAMNLAHGGHLTHGSPVNFSGKLFNIVPYGVQQDTHLIDMNEVRDIALREKPVVILAGHTAYPRTLDFEKFRQIADEVGAYLMVDMAHFAGLVAGKAHPDPFLWADVITTTTHKTLRGPRGAVIFSKIEDRIHPEDKKNLAKKIDFAIFPFMQGGPLDHVIAAKAVAFKEALHPSFEQYAEQIIVNAQALAESLMNNGVDLVSRGTDNHLVLADLTKTGLAGKQGETLLDSVGIYTNKNMVPFDQRKPMDPSGLRIGTPALTTRGFTEDELKQVGEMIAHTLHNPNQNDILEGVRKKVEAMTQAHPLYDGWSYETPE
ncbi:serine hydroxymethyltransferase [bacterium]|jgi:glycine hydroxymethyltransferase|nr:serine hydroxymethyltransferase [bacterium]MDP6571524.1 serine hydroxymethyltransferase [Patescibacteria group bacterium]MDP6756518.1 serine hydroxymethyltransferase [Patescibacteria group bacterium]|tara:strand:- start:1980 stop:3269 length:1290 start_codon:yes stop_codon:yes gene_type:complete